jgi:type I restriction enzyme S subunit
MSPRALDENRPSPIAGAPLAPLLSICKPRQWPMLSKEALLPQGYPVFGANGFIGFTSEPTHAAEAIAITCRGAACGAVHRVPAGSYITGNAMALDGISTEIVHPEYLYYALKHRGLADVVSGSAQPQITRASLASVEIPLPPLADQRRVAALLTSVDRRIDAGRAVIDQLEIVREALATDLLKHGLPARRGSRSSRWSRVRLGDLARVEQGYAFPSEAFSSEGIPVVRMSNLRRGEIDLEGAARVSPARWEGLTTTTAKYALREGDVLLGLSGSLGPTGSLGNFARVRAADLPLFLNQRVGRFAIVDRQRLHPGFLYELVASGAFRVRVQAAATKLAQANVSGRQIEALAWEIPPFDEQAEIAAALGGVKDRMAAEARELDSVRQVLSDLLRSIFARREL